MGYNNGDETVEFEAAVEVTTAKARLLLPTVGPDQAWCPKSVTISMTDVGGGLFVFVVHKWWAAKNGLV